MTGKLANNKFRNVFKVVASDNFNWFPGHMNKGLKQMQQKLRTVDCIVEVHDCRIPFSGRNTDFKYKISGVKPHILVMNKVDMIDSRLVPRIRNKLVNDCENVVFTNCKEHSCRGVKELFPLARKLIDNSERYNRTDENDFCMMIIGIPNVGKSSLINALRNRFLGKSKATHVGAVPGITRSVLMKIKISQDPLFYMLDTPGILTPKIPTTEVGLRLALCATIQDSIVGENIIADYLLFWLNLHEEFKYVDVFQLEKPTDDIADVLSQIAMKQKKFLKIRDSLGDYLHRPDLDWAAKTMLKKFRNGELGKIMLDLDLL